MVTMLLFLGGCETVGYYSHLAGGQLKLLAARKPVADVLRSLESSADPQSVQLAARLELSQAVLDYARDVLGLEVGGRYRSYVALDRDAVVWNLFAAPELSLTPHTWCYPLVGCAPYRGYFDLGKAEQQQARLTGQGLETFIGGVAAYSTLGWFDDPLLSTFVDLPEGDFVELLLHELAHSRVWVRGDTTFNESFASFVGRQGTRDWYRTQDRMAAFAEHLAAGAAWQRAMALLEATRDALGGVYEDDASPEEKAARKAQVLNAASDCLDELADVSGREGYRRLIPRLNNAYLASLATYTDDVPAFAALYAEAGSDWPAFFRQADVLAGMDDAARSARLADLANAGRAPAAPAPAGSGQQQVAAHGDDQRAEQVQCEAFSGHGFDGEVSGAEHDQIGRGGDG